MIAILCHKGDRGTAESISVDLVETYRGQLDVQIVSAPSPVAWPGDVSWDDVLIVLFHRTEFPEAARDFAADFLRARGEYSLVLPVSLDKDCNMPPKPVHAIKALSYDDEARGPFGRIARRVGAMLGLKLRRQDNKILISYRAVDGIRIANQLRKHLSGLGYRVWLDEARDPLDEEPTILPGTEVQDPEHRA